ncbi:MAG: hypothetical protein AB7S71_03575 [Dongiaceae bacterium]
MSEAAYFLRGSDPDKWGSLVSSIDWDDGIPAVSDSKMIVLGGDYEHTLGMGLTEQDVRAGIIYRPHANAAEFLNVVLNKSDFEISECSLANYLLYRGNDDDWLTAIPVFPIRAFRHGDVVVRKDSKLREFRELAGRKVGIRDYSQTLAVWMRGILKDEYQLDWRDVHWVSVQDQRFSAPQGVKLTTTHVDLEELLIIGEIDAVIMGPLRDSSRPPAERRLRPLLDNPREAEIRYFGRTGVFPIRHTIVLRKEVLTREPGAARAVFDSYVAAKKTALRRRLGATLVPWGEQAWSEALAVFGSDSHPYGLTDGNRKQVSLLVGYLLDQGFIRHGLNVDELFVPGSVDWRE